MKKRPLLWITFVALLLRLLPVLLTPELSIGLDDMFQYDMLARSLAEGKGYRWYAEDDLALIQRYVPIEVTVGDYDPQGILTSFRPPAYPAFLAIIYKLSGMEARFYIARIVQAFLGALIPLIAYNIARFIYPAKPKIAWITGWVLAFYPMLIVYPLALATENLFIPLALAAIYFTLRAAEEKHWAWLVFSGLGFGLAILTRSVFSAVAPLALIYLWWKKRSLLSAFLFSIVILICVIPWSVRNTQLNGRFTFIESALGYQLYLGYHPESEGTFKYGISIDLLKYLGDDERDQIGTQKTIEFIQADPARIPRLMFNKFAFFFGLERRAISYFYANGFVGPLPVSAWSIVFVIFVTPFILICLFASLSVFTQSIQGPRRFLLLVILFYLMPHLLILAEPRFHLTVMPILLIFATEGLLDFKAKLAWLSLPQQRLQLLFMILLCVLFLLIWSFELIRDSEELRLLFSPQGYNARIDY